MLLAKLTTFYYNIKLILAWLDSFLNNQPKLTRKTWKTHEKPSDTGCFRLGSKTSSLHRTKLV